MPFKIDYTTEGVLEWHQTADGVTVHENTGYTPTIYAAAKRDGEASLDELAEMLGHRSDVVSLSRERWRPAFRREPEPVLRIDVSTIDRVQPLAGSIRRSARPGQYRLFNVDFSREFRYCLEEGLDPQPSHPLRVLHIEHPEPGSPAAPVERLTIDEQAAEGTPEAILTALSEKLESTDPDVLILSTAALVPALFETATQHQHAFQLGRRPGYEQLASKSTYESYGQVGHSPARYTVPGRAIIDRSNTFFYRETNLAGCLDLVGRSRKPLQELSWASIGNVLTAIQIREATARGVLVPWKSWRHEFPKTMRQLHDADRGGFTFSPDVGIHESVHELDFSSLYPNIICTRNISPETIRCDCHDRKEVPGLGYSICEEDGYLPTVLQPIIDDRDALKAQIQETDDPQQRKALEGQADALKWILVSCFGYQGFSNAKFGRIECHEAINAYAREILLDAKETLERAGWRVVHGIVDSLWVTAADEREQVPLKEVARDITEETGIRLEYEAAYDWIAFVPLRDSESGALTKYFGARQDGSYKYRGIECRQRSTPEFVADCQQALIETFDSTRRPEAVCAELRQWIQELEAESVDPERLVITKRASKKLEEYTQRSRTTAALYRQRVAGTDSAPGQSVSYVVVDDSKTGHERVRLAHERDGEYDIEFYRRQLIRAAESILSPIGWRENTITEQLSGQEDASLHQFR